MARRIALNPNPVFQRVTGLANRTLDLDNLRSDRMATEEQLMALENRATALQRRINECCRDLCIWKTYIRIVEEKSGLIVSDFFDNMQVGHTRRGIPFTVEFARPLDFTKFSDAQGASDRQDGNNKWGCKIITNPLSNSGTPLEDRLRTMLNDVYDDSSGSLINTSWPYTSVNSQSIISNVGNSGTIYKLSNLPRLATTRENRYRIYIDNGKLKIDVLGKNQFGNAANSITPYYQTVFITQWVLKDGATL